jgi:hypothetical protein
MMIVPPPYPHCVYLLTRRDQVVIYVGVTSNLFARLGQHSQKSWWAEVFGIQVEAFPSRGEADAREDHLISLIAPFYNVAGNNVGLARHLEELRLATSAIRAGRMAEVAVAKAQAPRVDLTVVCTPGRRVTLAEAASLLPESARGRLSVDGLRTASRRAGFPMPVGIRGSGPTATKLYDLDALLEWRKKSP